MCHFLRGLSDIALNGEVLLLAFLGPLGLLLGVVGLLLIQWVTQNPNWKRKFIALLGFACCWGLLAVGFISLGENYIGAGEHDRAYQSQSFAIGYQGQEPPADIQFCSGYLSSRNGQTDLQERSVHSIRCHRRLTCERCCRWMKRADAMGF